MVSCGAGIIKILLGVFNLLWLILGGGVLYIGVRLVLFKNDIQKAADLADVDMKTASFVILAVGAVIALIAFLGFFGACCESSFMLNAYGFLLLIMIAGQIYVVVVAFKNNGGENSITWQIEDKINKALQEVSSNKETRFLLEEVQHQFKCCGWKNVTDFNLAKVPATCCGRSAERNQPLDCDATDAIAKGMQGCSKALPLKDIESLFKGVIGVGIAVILFELILVFAACCLAREVNK